MSIVIENPTAESIFAALQDVPAGELSWLKQMLLGESREETVEEAKLVALGGKRNARDLPST